MSEMIVCMAKNRVIGRDGKMPWDLPHEYEHFLREVSGSSLIMGRKNYEINQNNEMLKKMTKNWFILSHRQSQEADQNTSFGKIKDALTFMKKNRSFVIGGEEIYRLFLPHIEVLHLSVLDQTYAGDIFFPEHEHFKWKIASTYRDAKELWSYYKLLKVN